jgi:hypothetical protein
MSFIAMNVDCRHRKADAATAEVSANGDSAHVVAADLVATVPSGILFVKTLGRIAGGCRSRFVTALLNWSKPDASTVAVRSATAISCINGEVGR